MSVIDRLGQESESLLIICELAMLKSGKVISSAQGYLDDCLCVAMITAMKIANKIAYKDVEIEW